MTRRKVCAGVAPRSAEASISERGTRSSAATIGQHHEREPHVEKDEEGAEVRGGQRRAADHRQREHGLEQPAEAEPLGEPGHDALLGEDELPRVDAHEIARPERQHHPEVEQRLQPEARAAHHEVGEREGEHGRRHRHGGRHRSGAHEDVEVGRAEELAVGGERELGAPRRPSSRRRRRSSAASKASERAEVDDPEPEQRWAEQQHQEQARGGDRGRSTARDVDAAGCVMAPPAQEQCRDGAPRSRRAPAEFGVASAFCSSTRSWPPPSSCHRVARGGPQIQAATTTPGDGQGAVASRAAPVDQPDLLRPDARRG